MLYDDAPRELHLSAMKLVIGAPTNFLGSYHACEGSGTSMATVSGVRLGRDASIFTKKMTIIFSLY